MTRIAAYCRFSPRPKAKMAEAGENACDSIAVQQQRIEAWLSARGITTPVTWYIDRLVSARSTPLAERPEGGRLIAAIEAGEHKHIVAAGLDRLFRNTVDGLLTLPQWQRAGIQLALCDGVTLDLASADGYFVGTLLLAVAQREPHKTSERTSASHRTRQTKSVRTGRFARYGYQFDLASRHPETGLPCQEVPNPAEQSVIRIIESLSAGGRSADEIAVELDVRQIRNRAGDRFRRAEVVKILGRKP